MGKKQKRRKKKKGSRAQSSSGTSSSGGIMQGMLGGFQKAAGAGPATQKKKGWFDYIFTGLLIAAVIAVIYYRFVAD